jgi:hypothetical protein
MRLDTSAGGEMASLLLKTAHLALVVINSPRIVLQQTSTPHRGLAKQITREKALDGFELRDWTEIRLQVTKPRYIDDGEPHEDVITGKRALHFCRPHIRICSSGKLTYVREHWRGDPAIGVTQSRYAGATSGGECSG